MFLDMACIVCRRSLTSCKTNNDEMLCRNTLRWIWDSPIGIQNLSNRSLIKWSAYSNTLVIHDQLQAMACRIVVDEVDGNKSRVWDFDEGVKLMCQKRVSKTLEGLFLHESNESWSGFEELENYFIGHLNKQPIDCFDHLRLLNLSSCGEKVVQYYIGLSTKNLKWVDLNGSSITKSNIEGMKFLSGVRVLNMQSCESLKSLPSSIGNLSLLVKFNLSYCIKLKSLPKSIGGLQQLQVLNLNWCESLETLPTTIGNLSPCIKLDLIGCLKLKSLLESICRLQQFQIMRFRTFESIKALPTSIGNLSLLTGLNLCGCSKLKSLPESIGKLQQLQGLDLRDCKSLEALPTSIGNLSLLTKINLCGCSKLKSSPESIGKLQQLQVFHLCRCESLKSIPTSIGYLPQLDLSKCGNLESLLEC